MDYQKVETAAEYIRARIGVEPEIGLILGSGLDGLCDSMERRSDLPYAGIPGFPRSTVKGHAGVLSAGVLFGRPVLVMNGRFHYYEGYSMQELCFPIFVMKLLGVKSLIVTNACGAINPGFHPGELMLITDYINFSGANPLIGPNDERFGPRFPDMTEAYAPALREKALQAAESAGLTVRQGVYTFYPGPCFESAAEIRAFAAMGADAVGMSTVPETQAANYLGLKVLGISCLTNMATGLKSGRHSHEEVLQVARQAGEDLRRWTEEILRRW